MNSSGLLFPKTPAKKKRKKHPQSILHNKDDRTCYLCMKLEGRFCQHKYLEEHHIFEGSAERPKSEEYGLKVYLCREHHREGPMAVHKNGEVRDFLEAEGQRAFETVYGHVLFMKEFLKNYI